MDISSPVKPSRRTPTKNRPAPRSSSKSPHGNLRAPSATNDIEMKLRIAEEKVNIVSEGMRKNVDKALKRMIANFANVHRVAELEVQRHGVENMYEQLHTEMESV